MFEVEAVCLGAYSYAPQAFNLFLQSETRILKVKCKGSLQKRLAFGIRGVFRIQFCQHTSCYKLIQHNDEFIKCRPQLSGARPSLRGVSFTGYIKQHQVCGKLKNYLKMRVLTEGRYVTVFAFQRQAHQFKQVLRRESLLVFINPHIEFYKNDWQFKLHLDSAVIPAASESNPEDSEHVDSFCEKRIQELIQFYLNEPHDELVQEYLKGIRGKIGRKDDVYQLLKWGMSVPQLSQLTADIMRSVAL